MGKKKASSFKPGSWSYVLKSESHQNKSALEYAVPFIFNGLQSGFSRLPYWESGAQQVSCDVQRDQWLLLCWSDEYWRAGLGMLSIFTLWLLIQLWHCSHQLKVFWWSWENLRYTVIWSERLFVSRLLSKSPTTFACYINKLQPVF